MTITSCIGHAKQPVLLALACVWGMRPNWDVRSRTMQTRRAAAVVLLLLLLAPRTVDGFPVHDLDLLGGADIFPVSYDLLS